MQYETQEVQYETQEVPLPHGRVGTVWLACASQQHSLDNARGIFTLGPHVVEDDDTACMCSTCACIYIHIFTRQHTKWNARNQPNP